MFATVSLDYDVADDVVTDDHGANEGDGEEVEVAGQNTQDCSSTDDVKNIETHSNYQLTVR